MKPWFASCNASEPAPGGGRSAAPDRGRRRRLPRLLGYAWAAPASAIGLLLAAAAAFGGARLRVVDGVLEVAGGRLGQALRLLPAPLGFEAITFGHVVLGRSPRVLARLRSHEQVHVRQYERWGALFFPAYAASSVWQFLRGRDPYRDNRFEREAFAAAESAAAAAWQHGDPRRDA